MVLTVKPCRAFAQSSTQAFAVCCLRQLVSMFAVYTLLASLLRMVFFLQGVFTKQRTVMPRPLTPTFFSDRIPSIGNETSAAMFHALQGANLLDLHDKLLADPR